MTILKLIGLGLLAVVLGGAAIGAWLHSRDRAQMRAVWQALEAGAEAAPAAYDPSMVADMPEVARRYFAHAIAPGTPLHRVVRLEMAGTFILGGNEMPMRARQILSLPGRGFVWDAEMGSGLMRFAGSDGYHAPGEGGEQSWTKFWLRGLVPLARIGDNPDHARAAAARAMLEAVWAPAALLPQFGARWVQTGPDSAEISFDDAREPGPMHVTLDASGAPHEVWAQRWTDANPEKTYRLQPFGGRMLESGSFEGFTVPVRVELGNMWGTDAYAPFFRATVSAARFGP